MPIASKRKGRPARPLLFCFAAARSPGSRLQNGALAAVGQLLGIRVIAEGVEEAREALVLRHLGITLMQGYLFARPQFEALPPVDFDAVDRLLEARIDAA
jgi:EAL domain-containing protein (putative c-di-GMP-specific phosphodiesterase class I)